MSGGGGDDLPEEHEEHGNHEAWVIPYADLLTLLMAMFIALFAMSSIDSTGTRIWYEPTDARLFEYRSSGPGAVASPTRRVLTAEQAAHYTIAAALGDWTPPREGTSR